MAGYPRISFLHHCRGIGALVIACAALVSGCYKVPLVAGQDIPIDAALLGEWYAESEDREPMTVLGVSETEYLIRFPGEGAGMRAYLIDVGDRRYLQVFVEDGEFYAVAS